MVLLGQALYQRVTGEVRTRFTLTSRNKEKGAAIPMCGVPYHAAEGYIARLIQKGHRVAICDQMEDPKLTKKIVRREVTRVLSPGTALDSALGQLLRHALLPTLSLLSCGGVSSATNTTPPHKPVVYQITVTGTSAGTTPDAGQSAVVTLVVDDPELGLEVALRLGQRRRRILMFSARGQLGPKAIQPRRR